MDLDPRRCVGLNLRSAARRISRRYDTALAGCGLSGSQFSMLNYVAEDPGCGVARVAEFLDMDVSTATRNLRSLLSAGYVKMTSGAADARRREIRLTAKGTRALAKAYPLWREAQRASIAALGESRAADLLRLLAAVR